MGASTGLPLPSERRRMALSLDHRPDRDASEIMRHAAQEKLADAQFEIFGSESPFHTHACATG
jgi:hypothetical protein